MVGEKIFHGADGGRAYGDPAAEQRRKQGALGGDGNFVEFAVNRVLFDRGGGDGLKRAEADVQGEIGVVDALSGERGEEFGREMQAGGGRGDGDLAIQVGVNSLVAGAVGDDGGGGRFSVVGGG